MASTSPLLSTMNERPTTKPSARFARTLIPSTNRREKILRIALHADNCRLWNPHARIFPRDFSFPQLIFLHRKFPQRSGINRPPLKPRREKIRPDPVKPSLG